MCVPYIYLGYSNWPLGKSEIPCEQIGLSYMYNVDIPENLSKLFASPPLHCILLVCIFMLFCFASCVLKMHIVVLYSVYSKLCCSLLWKYFHHVNSLSVCLCNLTARKLFVIFDFNCNFIAKEICLKSNVKLLWTICT